MPVELAPPKLFKSQVLPCVTDNWFSRILRTKRLCLSNTLLRTNDGTTPMILATRLAVEGVVDALINANADVNAVDDHGKSALHWAAAVNNVEALSTLLAAGCKLDVLTDREESPLFLAAKEGSYEAVQMLLENGVNREITDHMDR